MKYEIKEMMNNEVINEYKADAIEIKKDDYGCFVDDKQIGKKVGFKQEGKSRKTWVHPVRTNAVITNTETGEVTVLKSNVEILKEMGRFDLAEKVMN